MFRFEKNDLKRLQTALRFPDEMKANGTKTTGFEALCIMLRRLAYPNRLIDLAQVFGRSKTEISIILNFAISHVYNNFGHVMQNLNNFLHPPDLRRYAEAIEKKGAPLHNCWGFIDDTAKLIARPSQDQRIMFSGHKRVHALKFQSVQLPNGIIAHMYGPIEGQRRDSGILTESGILTQLENFIDENGEPFYLFGDAGYPLRPQLLCKGVQRN